MEIKILGVQMYFFVVVPWMLCEISFIILNTVYLLDLKP